MTALPTPARSALRVAVGVAAVLTVPLVADVVVDGAGWSLSDFVLAGVLLAVVGVVLELAVHRVGGALPAVAVAALGGAAVVAGGTDDAPGLVLLGLVMVSSAAVLGWRTTTHRAPRRG